MTIIVRIAKQLYYTMWNELFHKLVCLCLFSLPSRLATAFFFLQIFFLEKIHGNCWAIYRRFAMWNMWICVCTYLPGPRGDPIHFIHLIGSDGTAKLWANVRYQRGYESVCVCVCSCTHNKNAWALFLAPIFHSFTRCDILVGWLVCVCVLWNVRRHTNGFD